MKKILAILAIICVFALVLCSCSDNSGVNEGEETTVQADINESNSDNASDTDHNGNANGGNTDTGGSGETDKVPEEYGTDWTFDY